LDLESCECFCITGYDGATCTIGGDTEEGDDNDDDEDDFRVAGKCTHVDKITLSSKLCPTCLEYGSLHSGVLLFTTAAVVGIVSYYVTICTLITSLILQFLF